MAGSLRSRQISYDDGRYYSSWWYDTRAGTITKWSIFFGILFLISAFVIGGRWHAMSRIKKGLEPLAYHKILLSRRQKALYDPSYRTPQAYYTSYPNQNSQYNMYTMPPPMYDPNSAPPPIYQPPPGAKINPSQGGPVQGDVEGSPSYVEPPAAAHTHNTGTSNNPFRG